MSVNRLLGSVTVAAALVVAGCGGDDEPEPGQPAATETSEDESPAESPDDGSPENETPDESPGSETTDESPPSSPTDAPAAGPVEPTDVEELVTDLDAPWSIAFLSDGEALVSQRDEETIVHVTESGDVTEVGEVPGVEGEAEGGLLGIAFDPNAPDTLYVYATAGDENQVLRTTYDDGEFGEFETLLDGIPASPRHDGGRIAFGPDGMLYIATGDAGDGSNSQDLDTLAGKILRVTPDGDIPDDNPFDDSAVYSYGHRNVEGLAFDDEGRLWASEFGDSAADELNLIEAGGNYGWPEVEGIPDDGGSEDYIDPVHEWPVEDASPSGLAYVDQTLFMAALRGARLWQIPLPGGEAGEPTDYLDDYGRLRDAVVAPDGTLWVLTNNTDGRTDPREGDDRILRLTLSDS
ncbi:PQQ-dependent sugar dehydrogenase [Phytoactinopolyspora endophytica]|uniref:PQQ-dependent sugar dehydrogenase n=1 Tax=Phytoactinopolyspora endophytica TaxID=1642495 RepID=UPI00101CBF1F|nr:PQQ-dependent sugar dehydrogenase [Phytoactinopolyspora endophytica]